MTIFEKIERDDGSRRDYPQGTGPNQAQAKLLSSEKSMLDIARRYFGLKVVAGFLEEVDGDIFAVRGVHYQFAFVVFPQLRQFTSRIM